MHLEGASEHGSHCVPPRFDRADENGRVQLGGLGKLRKLLSHCRAEPDLRREGEYLSLHVSVEVSVA